MDASEITVPASKLACVQSTSNGDGSVTQDTRSSAGTNHSSSIKEAVMQLIKVSRAFEQNSCPGTAFKKVEKDSRWN